MRATKLTSIFFIILSSILCISAFAEDQANIGEIKVIAGVSDEAKDAPSSFATIIYPSEENITFENVSELLSASPGVTSRSLGGLGQYSTVSIRGSSPEQVSVFLDGVKLNTASTGAFDFSTIPIESIERIEIIRGGGTAQFGPDAIGGVINIITKEALEKPTTEVFAGGGSFTTIKAGASFRNKLKKNAFTLSWAHLQSKGDYTFKTLSTRLSGAPSGLGGGRTFTRIHNGFISESLLASWTHNFNKRTKLTILNDFFFTDRETPGTEEETTQIFPANPLDGRERIIRNTNSIKLDISNFFMKPLAFTFAITNNFDFDNFKDETPALGNPINENTYNYALNPYLNWDLFLDHKILTQLITLRYDYRLDFLTDSSPIQGTPLTGTKTRNTNSILVQDELGFLKEKIIFIPSIRFANATDFSNDLAYRSGLRISPLSWFVIKANIDKSFRYPSFNELYFPDQGYIRGNPDLRKEEAWNLDAGIEVNTKYASLELAYFKNWIDNLIVFVPISATTIMPVNTFKVNMYGLETELTFKPIKYVSGWINYTYLSAHYASNNNQLPGRPKHEFNTYLELNHELTKSLSGSLFGRFNYKYDVPINAANSVFLAARSKLDLGINLRFAKYYYLIFEAKNITNVQIYDSRGFPLPRRSFFATLGAKWR